MRPVTQHPSIPQPQTPSSFPPSLHKPIHTHTPNATNTLATATTTTNHAYSFGSLKNGLCPPSNLLTFHSTPLFSQKHILPIRRQRFIFRRVDVDATIL